MAEKVHARSPCWCWAPERQILDYWGDPNKLFVLLLLNTRLKKSKLPTLSAKQTEETRASRATVDCQAEETYAQRAAVNGQTEKARVPPCCCIYMYIYISILITVSSVRSSRTLRLTTRPYIRIWHPNWWSATLSACLMQCLLKHLSMATACGAAKQSNYTATQLGFTHPSIKITT